MTDENICNELRDTVREAISREIGSGRLAPGPDCIRLFTDRGYLSGGDEEAITADISIEVSSGLGEKPGLVVIIHIMDNPGRLLLEDVAEFQERAGKIAGNRVKPILVSSQALNMDAFRYASTCGMGIVRIMPAAQVLWLGTNFSPLSFKQYDRIDAHDFKGALLDPTHVAQNRDFYAFSDGHLFGDWNALLTFYIKKYYTAD